MVSFLFVGWLGVSFGLSMSKVCLGMSFALLICWLMSRSG